MAVATTRVVLVRHAESVAQVEGRIAGHRTCTGLSARGRRQATALRSRLDATGGLRPVTAVYTSVIRRAVETAEVLAPALDAPQPVPLCDWCELHMEPVDGLTWAELRTRHPVDGDPDDPDRPRVAGAETWSALYARIGTNLRRIATDHAGERVVVVTHGGSIGASLVAFGHVPVADAVTVIRSIRNTSLTEWRHSAGRWHLDRFDDATHIEATPGLHDPTPHQRVRSAGQRRRPTRRTLR